MTRLLGLISLLLVGSTTAFVPAFNVRQATALNLLTQEETDALLHHATSVAKSKDCTQDDVDGLIKALHEQQNELYGRIEKLKKTIASLETVSNADDRKVDEVRETIRALYRVFQLGDKASGNDYPKLSRPTGWSGEIGDGPKTAYDVLPPKKYKP